MAAIDSISYALKCWSAAIPRFLFAVGPQMILSRTQSLRTVQGFLDFCDRRHEDPLLGTIELQQLLPLSEIKLIGNFADTHSSETRDLRELCALGMLASHVSGGKIFEFGTFIGRTTRLLALNAGLKSEVYTIDLQQDLVDHEIGQEFKESPENAQICQLLGDSVGCDLSDFSNTIDFCWIDGAHDFEHCWSDTLNALMMVKAGGFIAWHDYRHTAWWSGVTKAVRLANRLLGGGVRHIADTTMAILHVDSRNKTSLGSKRLSGQ